MLAWEGFVHVSVPLIRGISWNFMQVQCGDVDPALLHAFHEQDGHRREQRGHRQRREVEHWEIFSVRRVVFNLLWSVKIVTGTGLTWMYGDIKWQGRIHDKWQRRDQAGWGPDREVCDASSLLFLSWFLLFVSTPFSSLIAEKNTCRFGARWYKIFFPSFKLLQT